MGDPAALSLYSARERAPSKLDATLIGLAQCAAKRVSTRVLRELLATASQRGATALFIDAARRLLGGRLFGRIDDAEKLFVLSLFGDTVRHPPLTEKLLDVLDHPHLGLLLTNDRQRLLAYAVGPRSGEHSAPSHGETLMGFWLRRAQEVQDFLGTRPNDRAVHDYLVEPSRPLHLLRTLADLDLLIVAFGSPGDPATLSYSRTYHVDEAGHAEPAVISPSPYIASAWKTKDRVARQLFEARTTTLTRLEELDLVRWIEGNHIVGPRLARRRGEVPFGMVVNARRFAEAVEAIANLFASVRGPLRFHHARLRSGIEVPAPRSTRRRPVDTRKPQNRAGRAAPALVGGRHA